MQYGERDVERIAVAVMGDDGLWHIDDTTGVLDPGATLTRKFAKAQVATALTLSAASTDVYTPPAGKRVRLKWLYIATPSSSAETIATVLIGASTHYIVPLPAPGVFMRSSVREGAADEKLTVTLAPSTTAYIDFEVDTF